MQPDAVVHVKLIGFESEGKKSVKNLVVKTNGEDYVIS
jgi:hypothetical protein